MNLHMEIVVFSLTVAFSHSGSHIYTPQNKNPNSPFHPYKNFDLFIYSFLKYNFILDSYTLF